MTSTLTRTIKILLARWKPGLPLLLVTLLATTMAATVLVGCGEGRSESGVVRNTYTKKTLGVTKYCAELDPYGFRRAYTRCRFSKREWSDLRVGDSYTLYRD